MLFLAACHSDQPEDTGQSNQTVVIPKDTVPPVRTNPKTTPAARFSEPIGDELNDWKFAVELYETPKTFVYSLRIQAKEVRVNDSVSFPNLGYAPKPVLQKGNQPFTCLIGFLDKEGKFKEYKKVSFTDDQLRIKTTHTYYVGYTKP
ncbi:MAG: hypothetical protein KGO92_14610 [Bacteroidota bacterium]|nr:hypothetical protein [Bacteroidota bacterium]